MVRRIRRAREPPPGREWITAWSPLFDVERQLPQCDMRITPSLAALSAVAALVCCACGSSSSDEAGKPSHTATVRAGSKSSPSTPPSAASPRAGTASPGASPAKRAKPWFPGHHVQVIQGEIYANKAEYGRGWPWKTPNLTVTCSPDINDGALIEAADAKRYRLTGTITRRGVVVGDAKAWLWDWQHPAAFKQWQAAGARLCPHAWG
jgi:hypothetical protein